MPPATHDTYTDADREKGEVPAEQDVGTEWDNYKAPVSDRHLDIDSLP